MDPTQIKSFLPVKLICGIIASEQKYFKSGEELLERLFGKIDASSALFYFSFTDYYEKQMGKNLKRKFLSFAELRQPEELSEIKIKTNSLEEEIRQSFQAQRRVINLDPGYLTPSALILATTKDFSHRIPLQKGIYAHLELLFGKKEARTLNWTYPDFRTREYQEFFIQVRTIYLRQLRGSTRQQTSIIQGRDFS